MSGPTGRKLNRKRVVSLMRYIMLRPCTVAQLARFMGMSRTCANDWIRELHKNQCVHVKGYAPTLRSGYRGAIYAWGDGIDAPKPAPTTSAQRTAKCRDKSTLDRAWKISTGGSHESLRERNADR